MSIIEIEIDKFELKEIKIISKIKNQNIEEYAKNELIKISHAYLEDCKRLIG